MRVWAVASVALVIAFAAGSADSRSAPARPQAALVGTSGDRAAVDGTVRIVARFRAAARGTFIATGAFADSGSLAATRRVAGGQLRLTETLVGKQGTLRIRVLRACDRKPGTWLVLSGTGAYRGLTGGGAAAGGPGCGATSYPVRATYTGSLRTPPAPTPPPLAQPGRFAGGSSQREEIVFDVAESGRALGSVRLRVTSACQGTTTTTRSNLMLAGPFDIAPDGRVSIDSTTTGRTAKLEGRFLSKTLAEGTTTVSTSITIGSPGTRHECSASVTWRASQPPPTAPPGTYCGFTSQGPGVCVDVAPTGREVSRVVVGVVVRCQQRTEVELTLEFSGIPIGGHLGFTASSTSFEGLISGTGRVFGLVDPAGTEVTGSASMQNAVFDLDGTRYTCFFGSGRFTAKRQ